MTKMNLHDFVDSLKLPDHKASQLRASLEKDHEVISFLASREATSSTESSSALISPACLTLRIALEPEEVITGDDLTQVINSSWPATTWATPACVVLPNSAKDVSITLKIIKFFCVKFSVRSGGHSPNPGWSSVAAPGILIDLQRLNHINVSSDATTVTVGAGQKWGNVIEALDAHKVTVIGARSPGVGVGGLILGGGYFHFSPEFGLACDDVKTFEVVLANGSVVQASATNNPGLFWALKGGGSNFGIVTSFELYTVPVHEVWVEGLAFSPAQVLAVFDAYAAFQKSPTPDLKATVSVVVSLDIVLVALLYSASASSRPAAFAPFENLSPLTVVVPPTNTTVWQFMQIASATQATDATRHDYRAASSKINAKLYTDVYNSWVQQATQVRAATGANQTFTIQTFSGNLVQQGINKGGNPPGMPLEDFQCWTTLVDWTNAADDDAARSVSIETEKTWNKLSRERGFAVDFLYMNDASREQNPLASYGAANIAKLKSIAAKYDPTRVFQTLQNDGFLLRDV
ncbi:FAD linked oxidase-like protein [Canariomyces notabilis]|uniref:FAD linked oxidase-like protein n=1 Tax=Canariomyces notabilis TaxID=2074819 RepID=A0AAN6THX0_9PEZI|nr:FAD linked oxidase-like protein [Canariomyces arenarius]